MKFIKTVVLFGLAFLLVACGQEVLTVDDYINQTQTELDEAGDIDIDVYFEESDNAVVLKVNDSRYSENYQKYLDGEEDAVSAFEASIDGYKELSDQLKDELVENENPYQLWVEDHQGQVLMKYQEGELIEQFNPSN